ncbi:MAG TPA: peptidase [Geobacteraceae bacterium]
MPDLHAAFISLFTINMGVQPGERIVVFSDTVRPDERPSLADADRRLRLHEAAAAAARFASEAYGNASFCAFPATAASGTEPPESLWREVFGEQVVAALHRDGLLARLLAKEASQSELARARELVLEGKGAVAAVVVAMANNSTSHTRFRDLVNAAGGRFASLPHFDPAMFFSSMAVDWNALAARTARLAAAMNEAAAVQISTPAGSRLRLGTQGRPAKGDDGLLTLRGSFGNLPAGEVYLAPLEGTAEGRLVIEYAPTRRLAAPLTLIISGGNVIHILGDEPYRARLEEKFAESPLNRNIAELGIGTNDRASRPDNVLEAEKILGTIHIALGDNSGFGGSVSTPFHEDYVCYLPTLTAIRADGTERQLLVDGELQV